MSDRSKPASTAFPEAQRDIRPLGEQAPLRAAGRNGALHLVVIGIDRYHSQPKLHNAVSDARGAQQAFAALGFTTRRTFFDEQATGRALETLVREDLRTLHGDDSLVIFFAGHGHTEESIYNHGPPKIGYLMPVDAAPSSQMSWIRLDTWLREITSLPPRHILVILDACHSGIALDPQDRWRAGVRQLPEPLERLRARRSRRIITSALDGQLAADGGPRAGHSLFTGCLIEALSGEVGRETGFMTGSAIGVHVQQRVVSYPNSRQTPDIGALDTDDRGELVVALPWMETSAPPGPPKPDQSDHRGPPISPPLTAPLDSEAAPETKGNSGNHASQKGAEPEPPIVVVPPPVPPKAPQPVLALRHGAGGVRKTFADSLARQAAQREQQALVLSLIAGEPQTVLAESATWSAQRGNLTLVTQATRLDLVVNDLLAYMPWLRCLPRARQQLSRAARIRPEAVDATIDAKGGRELSDWIDHIARGDAAVQVSGWLFSMLRNTDGHAPDLRSAPAQGRSLLAIVGEMAPISVMMHHQEPSESWLVAAISTAAMLLRCLPAHSVGITAPVPLVEKVLASRDSESIAMARSGLIRLEAPAGPLHRRGKLAKGPRVTDRRALEQTLAAALERDPRTRGARFEQRVEAPVHERERTVAVALAARTPRLIVELDSWYHLRDPGAYQRERLKDVWLARAGFFVMRFASEDIERRLDAVVDEIALGLVGRAANLKLAERHPTLH